MQSALTTPSVVPQSLLRQHTGGLNSPLHQPHWQKAGGAGAAIESPENVLERPTRRDLPSTSPPNLPREDRSMSSAKPMCWCYMPRISRTTRARGPALVPLDARRHAGSNATAARSPAPKQQKLRDFHGNGCEKNEEKKDEGIMRGQKSRSATLNRGIQAESRPLEVRAARAAHPKRLKTTLLHINQSIWAKNVVAPAPAAVRAVPVVGWHRRKR